jgi:hypothetical protein
MTERRDLPLRNWRTGTEAFTIIDAHPYHKAVYTVDHKGAGEYEIAYDPQCPLCRKEQANDQGSARR